MEMLVLYENNITGPIPSELGLLSNLQFLSLEDNMMTSVIPTELASLETLVMLDLSLNAFEGSVESLLDLLRNESSLLQQLDLSGNARLTGTFPSELCLLSDLELEFDCSAWMCGCQCPCEGLEDANNGTNSTVGLANMLTNHTN